MAQQLAQKDIFNSNTYSNRDVNNEHSAIDLIYLSKQTNGNPNLEQEILKLFARQLMISHDRLQVCNSRENWVEIFNFIDASAQSVGAKELSNTAAQTAQDDNSFDITQRASHLARLDKHIDQVNRFLADLINQH